MCESPIEIIRDGEKIKVPCRKCILCRRKKCREWALKLTHEAQYHKKMCMITLTFRPKFLLKPKIKELTKYKQRRKHDGTTEKIKIKYKTMISPKYITDVKLTGWLVTLFIKKLRKELSKNDTFISMFAVGEHGSQNTHRAHWHILFFGIDAKTLGSVPIGKSKKNKDILWSPLIDKLWSYDKVKIGMHSISEVTASTIKYVANYTMKKMYKANENKTYPTIMRFSNQAKIGRKWARKYHKEMRKGYLQDQDGIKYSLPKAYIEELTRYDTTFDENMKQTAMKVEILKDEMIEKLKKAGMLSKEELKKKARRLEIKYKREERDTF